MGDRLKQWRETTKTTAREAARRCGVCPRTWHRWETGIVFPPVTRWAGIERVTGRAVTILDLAAAAQPAAEKKAAEHAAAKEGER